MQISKIQVGSSEIIQNNDSSKYTRKYFFRCNYISLKAGLLKTRSNLFVPIGVRVYTTTIYIHEAASS